MAKTQTVRSHLTSWLRFFTGRVPSKWRPPGLMTLVFMRFAVGIPIACTFLFPGVGFGQGQANTPASAIPPALTLAQATDILMQRSPAILAEAQSIAVARSEVEGSSKLPNPVFFTNSESYPAFSARPGSFLNNQELTGTIAETIPTAGKRGKRVAVARQALLVAGSNLENFKRQLRAELRQRYWAAVLATSQAKLARELLAQFDETLKLNEARYQQGEISGLEAIRLRTERLRFWNDVQQAELDLQNAKSAVLELLAAPQNTQFESVDRLDTTVPIPPLPELTSAALSLRPDLQAQQGAVRQQERQLSFQKSLAVPDLTVGAGYKRNDGVSTPVLNFSYPLPIFNRNQGGVHAAEADLERQRQLLIAQQLQVERQVKQAFDSLRTQQERATQIRQVYVPSAQKALDIAVQSYRLGSLDLIGLLDAERVYRETQRTAYQASFDLRIAESALEAATGKEPLQ